MKKQCVYCIYYIYVYIDIKYVLYKLCLYNKLYKIHDTINNIGQSNKNKI